MKQPRIKDFDPNAVPELGSPMDDLPSIQQPAMQQGVQLPGNPQLFPHPQGEPGGTSAAHAQAPPSVGSTPVRPYGRTTKRTIKRYAFEFYQDQIDALQHLSLTEKLQGEKGSMSEMVRTALDAYIAKRQQDQS